MTWSKFNIPKNRATVFAEVNAKRKEPQVESFQEPKFGLAEARESGLSKYWNGNPCKRGHLAFRYINGGCCECIATKKSRVRKNKMVLIDKLKEQRELEKYYD